MFRKIILVIFCCSIAGFAAWGSFALSKNLANGFASVISQVFPGISQPPTPLSSSSEPISSPAVVQETAAVKDIAQETAAVKEIKEITRLVQIEPAPPSQSAVEQVAQQISQSS